MKTFGLIGKSLSHSLSQQYFTAKFCKEKNIDAEYQLFPLNNIDEVAALLKHPTLLGFNVTVPYKSAIIHFLDEIDKVAQEVGAVNCVVKENGRWVGYNTDIIGFDKTISEIRCEMGDMRYETVTNQQLQIKNQTSALILGSGGAAKAVGYVLKQRNLPFRIVSRKKTKKNITYNDITEELIRETTFIINTTPLGMFPNVNEKPPIPYSALNSNHILIDLIYNPTETLFLKEGKKCGAFIINGFTMFEAQAKNSYLLFNV